MKIHIRPILLVLVLLTLIPSFAQETYRTSNTRLDYKGQWTKIATVEINTKYWYSSSIIELNGGNRSHYSGTAKLFFRVKQQAPFPEAPFIQLELLESNNGQLLKENFMAVHTTSSGSDKVGVTIVELYVRIISGHEIISFVPTHKFESAPAVFHETQPFIVDLPAGTQYPCVTVDKHARRGLFEGRVGIGTDSPAKSLEVKTGDQDGIRITAEGIPRLELDGWEGDELKSNWVLYSRPSNGEFGIWDDNQKRGRFRIDSLGNVGIGVTNPVERLHVSGTVQIDHGGVNAIQMHHVGVGGGLQSIGSNAKGDLILSAHSTVNGHEHLTIQQNTGNIGIGTTDPQAKLAVDGDILATKVKVVTDVNAVPDYVFDEGYDLKGLEEVQSYIQANKHLPEVPSATEMSEQGQDLGVMNLLLLKKIEELTLYVIEQQQAIQDLKKQVKSIKGAKR